MSKEGQLYDVFNVLFVIMYNMVPTVDDKLRRGPLIVHVLFKH